MERLDHTFSRAQVDFRRAMTSQQIDPLSFLNEPVSFFYISCLCRWFFMSVNNDAIDISYLSKLGGETEEMD